MDRAEADGTDPRSISVFKALLDHSKDTGGASELSKMIKAATKDKKKLLTEVTKLLTRYDYSVRDGKHRVLSPPASFPGLNPITVSKTPGEGRGLDNLASDLERAFGLSAIKKAR